MAKLMIDVLRDDKDLKLIEKNHNFNYEYVNLIEYIRNVYDFTTSDLDNYLNAVNPTIYQLLMENTTDLPEGVLKKILDLYYPFYVQTIEEIFESEKEIELSRYYDVPLLEKYMNNELFVDEGQDEEFLINHSKYFIIDNDLKVIKIRHYYNPKHRFDILTNSQNMKNMMNKMMLDLKELDEKEKLEKKSSNQLDFPFSNYAFGDSLIYLIDSLDQNYLESLFFEIIKQIGPKEDLEFINFISNYRNE